MDRAEANKLRVEKSNLANRNLSYEYWIPPGKEGGIPAVRKKANWIPERDQVVRDYRFESNS